MLNMLQEIIPSKDINLSASNLWFYHTERLCVRIQVKSCYLVQQRFLLGLIKCELEINLHSLQVPIVIKGLLEKHIFISIEVVDRVMIDFQFLSSFKELCRLKIDLRQVDDSCRVWLFTCL